MIRFICISNAVIYVALNLNVSYVFISLDRQSARSSYEKTGAFRKGLKKYLELGRSCLKIVAKFNIAFLIRMINVILTLQISCENRK